MFTVKQVVKHMQYVEEEGERFWDVVDFPISKVYGLRLAGEAAAEQALRKRATGKVFSHSLRVIQTATYANGEAFRHVHNYSRVWSAVDALEKFRVEPAYFLLQKVEQVKLMNHFDPLMETFEDDHEPQEECGSADPPMVQAPEPFEDEEPAEDDGEIYFCDHCDSWFLVHCACYAECKECTFLKYQCICKYIEPKVENQTRAFSKRKGVIQTLLETGNIMAQTLVQAYSCAFARIRNVALQNLPRDNYIVDKFIKKEIRKQELLQRKKKEIARPQIDEGPQGDQESPNEITSSNVVIETQRLASQAETTLIDDFAHMSCATENTNFEQLCNRWYSFANIKWSSSDEVGKKIGSWTLPKDPILERIKTISNFIPFQTFQYMRGNIEIRVEINTNKFQVGQLQLSWYYGAHEDLNFTELRENVYNASQRMHCLISAGSGNAAEMKIPFKYPTPFMAIRKSKDYFKHEILNLGKLSCIVLNQLSTPDTVYKNCTLNLFMKFSDIHFGGMREVKTELAEPQMLGAIAKGAKLLGDVANFTSKVLDSNCDKPLAPNPPQVLIPATINSLAYTDGVAEQHPTMRALPLAQTPSIMDSTQMEISQVAGTYGLVKTYKWSYTSDVGSQIFEIPASPIWENFEAVTKDESRVQFVPPVGVVASMFSLWRGELELRLDIISSTFHTGKLMLVYIAGGALNGEYSYEALKSCPNMVYDLNENRQCTFKIPYVANKPWWPRSVGMQAGEIPPPGIVRCYVLNPLIPMENIAATVDINLYLRGVPGSFEVSIPVAPAYGLSFNAKVIKPNQEKCSTIYSPFFCSTYVYLSDKYVTLFYSNVAGKYVTFNNLMPNTIYTANKCTFAGKEYIMRLTNPSASGTNIRVNYFVRARVNWASPVVLCFVSYNDALRYAQNGDITAAMSYYASGEYCKYYNAQGEEVEITGKIYFATVSREEHDEEDTFEYAYPQINDDVNPPTQILEPSQSTNFGMATFGESIKSLKSLGRRYNNYSEFTIKHNQVITVPIVYDRPELELTDKTRTYNDNVYRDGTLPLILSAYRFARGGLRFKLIFRKVPTTATNVVIYFDPEFKEVSRAISYEDEKTSPNYPMIIQNTSVNPTLEFEIPYYRAGQYNYLQKPSVVDDPNISEYFCLGAIKIVTTSDRDLEAQLVYALADDTQVDEFVGFPPMLPVSSVHVAKAQPQMETVPKRSLRKIMEDMYSDESCSSSNCSTPSTDESNSSENSRSSSSLSLTDKEVSDINKLPANIGRVVENERMYTNTPESTQSAITPNTLQTPENLRTHLSDCDSPLYTSTSWNLVNVDVGLPKSCANRITNKITTVVDNLNNKVVPIVDSVADTTTIVKTSAVKLDNTISDAAKDIKDISGKIHDTTDQLKEAAENVNGISQTVSDSATSLGSSISFVEKIMKALSGTYNWAVSQLASIKELLVRCVVVLLEPTKMGMAFLVYNIICLLFGSVFNCVSSLTGFSGLAYILESLWDIYNHMIITYGVISFGFDVGVESMRQKREEKAKPQLDIKSHLMKYVKWFMGIFHMNERDRTPISKILFSTFDSAGRMAMNANHISRFITDNVAIFRRVWYYVIGKQEETAPMLNLFGDEGGKQALNLFVKGVSLVTDPKNENKVKNHPIWSAIAFRLKRMSVTLTLKLAQEKNVRLTSLLSPYMKKIDDLTNELAKLKINSPVGYEPFVLYLHGTSGIGKSTIIDELIQELLNEIGVKYMGNPVYTRAPGVSHWDTLAGQPACKYDDFLQVSDPNDASLSEFFQMKTAADFSPSMAAIEEKKTKYNPYILALCSNALMINSPKVTDMNAANRRRDCLTTMKYISKTKKDTKISDNQYTMQEITDKKHVEFYVYSDPTDQNTYSKPMNYDSYLQLLKNKFKAYVQVQNVLYERRMKLIMRDWETNENEILNFKKNMDCLEVDLSTALDNIEAVPQMLDHISTLTSLYSQEFGESLLASEPSKTPDHNVAATKYCVLDQMTNYGLNMPESNKTFKSLADLEDQTEKFESPNIDVMTLFPVDSQEFEDHSHPNLNRARMIVDDVYLVSIYSTPERGMLDANNICTNSPCCLHLYNHDEYKILYDAEKDTFQLGELEIPNKPCQYRDAVGNVCELENCLLKSKAGMFYYRMQAQVQTRKFMKDNTIQVKGLEQEVTKQDKVVTRVITLIAKDKSQAEIFEAAKEDIEFFDESAIPILRRVYIKVSIIKNGFIRALVKGWKAVLGILSIIGFAAVIIYRFMYRKTSETIETVVEAVVQGSGAGKTYDGGSSYKAKLMQKKLAGQQKFKNIKETTFNARYFDKNVYHAESSLDNVHMAALTNKIFNNTFFVIARLGEGYNIEARCLGIRGHEALVPYHYIEHFEYLEQNEDVDYLVHTSDGKILQFNQNPFGVDITRIYSNKVPTGLATVEMPSTMGMFKDISNDFIGDETNYPSHAEFLILSRDDKHTLNRNVYNLPIRMNVATSVSPGTACAGWEVYDGFTYPMQAKGYCGSVLVCELRSRPVIVGMHTAGLEESGQGVSEPIHKRYFKKELKQDVPKLREYFTAFDLEKPETAKQQLDTNVTKIACIPKDKRPRQSRKTKIVKSKIAGVYPITTGPAPLSAKDPNLDASKGPQGFVNPIFCGSRKRGLVPIPFDSDILETCYNDLSSKIVANCTPLRQNVGKLSIKESVVGLPEIPGYDSIDLSSSEGYPWVLDRPDNEDSKKWLFDTQFDEHKVEHVVGIYEPLKDRVFKSNNMREEGVVPMSIFQGCLKDERKKIEKLSIPGKTRVFELSPVDATISHRMYTLDFVAAYTKSRFASEHAVGINPDSVEWIKLYNLLLNNSKDILVADYSNFGPCLQFECVKYAFKIINDWYSRYQTTGDLKKENKARSVMAYEIGQSVNICDDLLFQAHCGLPSGCTLTVYLNSIVNCLYMRYAFASLSCVNNTGLNVSDFSKYVTLVVYGDDLILSVKSEIISWFNNQTISEVFAYYNIKYTDVTKGSEIRPFCKIEDATFLKRGFKVWDLKFKNKHTKRIVLAPLEKEVIREIANWTHVSENLNASTLETSEASIRMMFGHGVSDYMYHQDKIVKALKREGLYLPPIPAWNVIANECFPYDSIPPVHFE